MNIKELHESDFNLWVEEMKIKIKNRDVETMDWDNLLDEIDDMGKSEKRCSALGGLTDLKRLHQEAIARQLYAEVNRAYTQTQVLGRRKGTMPKRMDT